LGAAQFNRSTTASATGLARQGHEAGFVSVRPDGQRHLYALRPEPFRELEAWLAVVIERTYRASVEALWAPWTTKAGFESWWGSEGFRVEVHALEASEPYQHMIEVAFSVAGDHVRMVVTAHPGRTGLRQGHRRSLYEHLPDPRRPDRR
jgi:hypothetical protein